jgi:hypothetical protein
LKSNLEKRKFIALNNTLQRLLEEQSDLELLLDYRIVWKEEDKEYKNWLDLKYAEREFDISLNWKKKVKLEKQHKEGNNPNFNENILVDNEIKRKIYFSLVEKLKEYPSIILKTIEEIRAITDGENISNLSDDQLKLLLT